WRHVILYPVTNDAHLRRSRDAFRCGPYPRRQSRRPLYAWRKLASRSAGCRVLGVSWALEGRTHGVQPEPGAVFLPCRRTRGTTVPLERTFLLVNRGRALERYGQPRCAAPRVSPIEPV